ncbi:NACHT domain-containing protein [Scytonema sp. PCC 10023]|uniref:NACHT domain-containing protein n=1 Tax=Scytonema sp. PCC 10023 TaxID=1680591 RepID=UPI0039C75E0D
MFDSGVISGALLKATLAKVAEAIIKKVNSQLNPTELEKALRDGMTAAMKQYDSPESQINDKALFLHCDDKQTTDFLSEVFKYSGVQEELEKPLKNAEAPDPVHLIEAFKRVAENQKIKLNKADIELWVNKFVEIYFQKTDAYLKYQITKNNYLNQLISYSNKVYFLGINVRGTEDEKSEQLENIFVMPDVVEEVQPSQRKAEFERNLLLTDEAETLRTGSGKLNERQAELIYEQRQRVQWESGSGKKFSAQQLLSEITSPKFVLLGAPGSGKTTLMSYFAVMLAQKKAQTLGLAPDTDFLPILIRLRDLSRHRDISILDYINQFARNHLSVKKLPPGFFEYWLEDGRALILLDGLDEIAETAKGDVVQRIEMFLKQFQQNRAIITSRPAGYRRDFFRTEDFPHYQLQSFDDAKIEEFINRWYDSRVSDPIEAQRRKDSLRKALSENDRIQLLARNPLLLTIIALIHRYQAFLPRERYKLFDILTVL